MFTGISIHHAMSLVFTGISIHHAMSLTGTGVKLISENEIILITDGRLHKSIQKGCIEPWHGAPLSTSDI